MIHTGGMKLWTKDTRRFLKRTWTKVKGLYSNIYCFLMHTADWYDVASVLSVCLHTCTLCMKATGVGGWRERGRVCVDRERNIFMQATWLSMLSVSACYIVAHNELTRPYRRCFFFVSSFCWCSFVPHPTTLGSNMDSHCQLCMHLHFFGINVWGQICIYLERSETSSFFFCAQDEFFFSDVRRLD